MKIKRFEEFEETNEGLRSSISIISILIGLGLGNPDTILANQEKIENSINTKEEQTLDLIDSLNDFELTKITSEELYNLFANLSNQLIIIPFLIFVVAMTLSGQRSKVHVIKRALFNFLNQIAGKELVIGESCCVIITSYFNLLPMIK